MVLEEIHKNPSLRFCIHEIIVEKLKIVKIDPFADGESCRFFIKSVWIFFSFNEEIEE